MSFIPCHTCVHVRTIVVPLSQPVVLPNPPNCSGGGIWRMSRAPLAHRAVSRDPCPKTSVNKRRRSPCSFALLRVTSAGAHPAAPPYGKFASKSASPQASGRTRPTRHKKTAGCTRSNQAPFTFPRASPEKSLAGRLRSRRRFPPSPSSPSTPPGKKDTRCQRGEYGNVHLYLSHSLAL